MTDFDTSPALMRLLSMSLMERIAAVARDIHSGADEFASIDPHDLAHALGVEQPEKPATGWNFASYAEKTSVEEQAENRGSVEGFVDYLKGKVTEVRFKELKSRFDALEESGESEFSFLEDKEREIIQEALAEDDLEGNQSNGMNCIASYTVRGAEGVELNFEGLVEDDGGCVELRTPYDERDGKFHDFSNCATDEWSG
jgi:hypothetical protein